MKLPTLLPGQRYCLPGVLGVSVCPAASWIHGLEMLMRLGSKRSFLLARALLLTLLSRSTCPPRSPTPEQAGALCVSHVLPGGH